MNYVKPSKVGIEKGPHTSIWIKSNEKSNILLSKGNGNLFCFAKEQTTQSLLQQFNKKGPTWPRDWNLTSDGCPNLECHKKDKFWEELELEIDKKAMTWWANKKSSSERGAWDRLEFCNKYNPSRTWPTPIVFQHIRSCIKQ